MKRPLLALLILFWVNFLMAQSWISSTQITSTSNLVETGSVIDNNGDVFTFGYFSGSLYLPNGDSVTSYGGRDYYLIKFLPDGTVDWAKNYGSTLNDFRTGNVDVDINGNAYITGGFEGVMSYSETGTLTSSGNADAFLIKVFNNGDVDWAENIGQGFEDQNATTLNLDISGDILVAGAFEDSISFNESMTFYSVLSKKDAFYAKFSPTDGSLIWAKQVKSLNGSQGYIWSIEATPDEYYLSGTFIDTFAFESDTLVSDYELNNTFLVKTDLLGNDEWLRKIDGNDRIYCYSLVADDNGNIYISSFYQADTIFIETAKDTYQEVVENNGDYDIYIVKYNPSGDMDWFRTIGGKGDDRVFAIEFFDNKIFAAGYISDTVYWGGKQLATTGISDKDMFTGAFTIDGNPRDANTTPGQGTDEARAIFQNGNQLYTVMRSNSDDLDIGEENYDSDGGLFYLVLGVIGCRPISVDNTIPINITSCYGDSTGSIQVVASGGFGSPWQYSIDNGLHYSDIAYHGNLPIDDYQVVVIDQEGCTEVGPLITLTQPDSLEVQVVSTEDITVDHDGSIVVVAQGGTAPFTYWLQPDGAVQGFGTFTFATGDSGTYVVAVNDLNGCGPVTTDSLVIQEIVIPIDTTGFETLSGVKARVYPNPTSGNLTVEMPFEGRKCQMEVISMTGQVVLKRKVFSNGGVITETLDLSDQAKGMYMLRIDGQTLQSAIMVK